MERYGFAPVSENVGTVFGAQPPSYPETQLGPDEVWRWLSFMRHPGQSIQRVCCLLGPKQLAFYRRDLLDKLRFLHLDRITVRVHYSRHGIKKSRPNGRLHDWWFLRPLFILAPIAWITSI